MSLLHKSFTVLCFNRNYWAQLSTIASYKSFKTFWCCWVAKCATFYLFPTFLCYIFEFLTSHCSTAVLDVLWCQPIKLIQVVSTSEFHEYWWNGFYFFHPLHFLQGLRSLKHWLLQKLSMKIFDQKFSFLIQK